jgi:hypothetical protein
MHLPSKSYLSNNNKHDQQQKPKRQEDLVMDLARLCLVIELKAIMSKSLYVWMAAHNSPLIFNFLEFMDLCSSP